MRIAAGTAFAEATVWPTQEANVELCAMTPRYLGAIFVQVCSRKHTEAFLERHRSAGEQFGGVPHLIGMTLPPVLDPCEK